MAKLTIIGNPSPVVGKKEMYTISTINDYFQQIIPTQPLLNPQTPIHWGIFVQEKNTWRRTTDNKEGQAVPYTFGQKSLHFKAIKIVAQQGNESGELIIHPQQAKEPKITKVELLDANYLPLPKGKKISYQDTIIARAHCIEMYKRNVSFTLWEDDAKGEGHDPVINMMNKINPVPIMGIVDEYGVAEAIFRLPFYTMAVQIANARIAAGETDEGPTHEYYVTAEYVAKHIMKASPNVNVINPTYIPPTPPSKTSANTPETKPSKPKPKADTPKFPITSSGKKQADPDAKILNAEFLNERAQPIEKAEVGDTVIIKITTQHMKGRNVTVRIWEEETGYKTHDKIYEKKWVLPGNENFIKVPITKKIYELGITPEDMANEKYDYKFQVYFIEVEPDNTHVTSQVIPITKSAKKLEVDNSRSPAIIKKPREKLTDEKCPNCKKPITIEEFTKIYPSVKNIFSLGKNNLTSTTIQQFLDSLNKTIIEFKINTCIKKAFFLAQISKETGFFSRIDENLYYTSEQALHSFWTKDSHPQLYSNPSSFFKKPEKLGNYVYRNIAENGNELSGDGYKFRGRGLIQITRKKGYRRFGTYAGKNLILNPDLLLDDLDLMTRSAGWFWRHGVLLKNGSEKDINEVAEQGDFKETTRLVHGTTSDLVARTEILNKIKPILETDKCRNNILNSSKSKKSNADIEYHIIATTGEIAYKLVDEKRENAEYFYHDPTGKIHNLGIYKLKKIKNIYGDMYKDRIKGDHVYLIDIRNLKNYKNETFKFILSINTDRYYMNDVTMAALLGAMLDCNYDDYTFNGFSNERGESIGGSKSHKNGMNGDLRYLRKDKSGRKVYLNLVSEKGDPCGWKGMDQNRQNQFNDSLYKYGWKSMLSWKYNGKTLNHSVHYDDHHDHLHVQSFKPKLKKM